MKKSVVFLPVLVIAGALYSEIVCSACRFDKEESLSEWIYGYHNHQDAESLVSAVRAMGKFEMIGYGYPEKDAFVIGFLSAVFSEQPGRIDDWLAELNDLPFPGAKSVILSAAAVSNTPQAREALNEIAAQSDPQTKQFIDSLLSIAPINFLTIPFTSPDVCSSICDILWGRYFATGDRRYINLKNAPNYNF